MPTSSPAETQSPVDTQTAFAAAHAQWHDEVEKRRTAPYGPLSALSLEWLTPEFTEFAGAPGRWRAEPDGTVEVAVADGESLELDGTRIAGGATLGPLLGIASVTLTSGELHIEVAARGDAIALRLRHPDAPDRREYRGTATFPADPAWVVPARFVPAERRDVTVDTAVAGIAQQYDSPGVAEFEVDGRPVRLTLFAGQHPGSLRALFADATGADLTFPAARSVEVVRDGDDALTIDFNRATNPPCAYSAHATCPFPPPENRLPVRIEAGELRPSAVAH